MHFDGISSETRLNDAMASADMAWWEMELPSGVVFFHPNKALMLGRKSEDFFHYTSFTDLIHPDDHAQAMKAMMDLMTGVKDVYETKYRIQHADGSYLTFYDKGKIVQRIGAEMRIAGMVVNLDLISKI